MEASEDFLELARALGCVPRDESEACEEILRGRDEEATTSGGGGGARRDPRMDKVRRFKMKGRLRAKRERLEAALARRRGEASEDEDEDEDGPDAEELERDLRLCDIEEAVYDALDEIPAMRVEFEMLSRRDELRDSLERERERMEREDERTKRREPEIFTIDRDAASGAIRVDPRERLRSEVFRPGGGDRTRGDARSKRSRGGARPSARAPTRIENRRRIGGGSAPKGPLLGRLQRRQPIRERQQSSAPVWMTFTPCV